MIKLNLASFRRLLALLLAFLPLVSSAQTKHTITLVSIEGKGRLFFQTPAPAVPHTNVMEVADGTLVTLRVSKYDSYELIDVLLDGTSILDHQTGVVSFTATKSCTITPVFEGLPVATYLYAEPANAGTFSIKDYTGRVDTDTDGGKTFYLPAGKTYTVVATPNPGYRFKSLVYAYVPIAGNEIHVESSGNVEVVFEKIPAAATYKIEIRRAEYGRVTIDLPQGVTLDKVPRGTDLTLDVEPDEGYDISALKFNGVNVLEQMQAKDFEFTVNENIIIEPEFSLIPVPFEIENTPGGTLSINGRQKGTLPYGREAIILATPDEGYELESIRVNGELITGNKIRPEEAHLTIRATWRKTTALTAISASTISLRQSASIVTLSGLTPHTLVHIHSLSGQLIATSSSDILGDLSLDLSSLSRGVYLIAVGNQTFKVINP